MSCWNLRIIVSQITIMTHLLLKAVFVLSLSLVAIAGTLLVVS